MARRPVGPTAGRGQSAPVAPAAPIQTMLTNALSVALDQIVPDPGQPRRHFDEDGLVELAQSIAEEGVLQPLLVQEDGALDDGRVRYLIVDGERRYRAARRVRDDVPVIVLSDLTLTDVRIRQLVANLQREDLDPLEEALALRQLMQLADLSFEQVGQRIGKSKGYVQRRTDLLYDPRMTEAVRSGAMNASVAIELKRFPDSERQLYLDRVAAGERLEVAQLREEKKRARAILFGNGAASHAVPESASTGRLPYRFDTDDTAIEMVQQHDGHAALDASPYRFDTASHATEGPDATDAGRSSGVAAPAEPVVDRGIGMIQNGEEWARDLAQALVESATVMHALEEWRAAGRPAGWGDAFLRTLDRQG